MKSVRVSIILCWIMLIVCFIIKLFGGNWFEIMCENKHFICVCDFIDNHIILQDVIAFVTYMSSTTLVVLAMSLIPKPNAKQLITIITLVAFIWVSQYINDLVKFILEPIMFAFFPFILSCLSNEKADVKTRIKKTWFLGIIGYVAVFSFQALSLVIKNIGVKPINDENTLLSLLLMIDYYIMIVLYYLYVKLKKGGKENG